MIYMADNERAKFTSIVPRAIKEAERKIPDKFNKNEHNSTFRNQELRSAKTLLKVAGVSATDQEIKDRLSMTAGSAWRIFKLRRLEAKKKPSMFTNNPNFTLEKYYGSE